MIVRYRNFLLLNCALISAAHSLAGASLQNGLPDGIALVTSRQGSVTLSAPDGRIREPELHAVEVLSGVKVTSGSAGSIFFSLSNGVGLGLHGEAQLRFESYQQDPVPAGRESIDYEPTRSRLVVQLLQGTLLFSAEHISPLSEVVIKLPHGQIQIHRASGKVLLNDSDAQISILSGIVAYDYPNTEVQTFINGPNQVRISAQSAREGRFAESQQIGTDPSSEDVRQLVRAARHARERVIFKVSATDPSRLQPVLVAKPAALQKPTPRPYRYLD